MNRLVPLFVAKIKLGMTTIATAIAGQLVAFTPKKVGRKVKEGKSCATVEPGKWVGPAKSAAAGEVIEVKSTLVPGTEVATAYEEKMDADGFDGCG